MQIFSRITHFANWLTLTKHMNFILKIIWMYTKENFLYQIQISTLVLSKLRILVDQCLFFVFCVWILLTEQLQGFTYIPLHPLAPDQRYVESNSELVCAEEGLTLCYTLKCVGEKYAISTGSSKPIFILLPMQKNLFFKSSLSVKFYVHVFLLMWFTLQYLQIYICGTNCDSYQTETLGT